MTARHKKTASRVRPPRPERIDYDQLRPAEVDVTPAIERLRRIFGVDGSRATVRVERMFNANSRGTEDGARFVLPFLAVLDVSLPARNLEAHLVGVLRAHSSLKFVRAQIDRGEDDCQFAKAMLGGLLFRAVRHFTRSDGFLIGAPIRAEALVVPGVTETSHPRANV